MKPTWIDLLCDPIDGTKLKLVNSLIKKGDLVSGKLVSRSGRVYRIKEGIPILLPSGAQSINSVGSFAFEWDEWGYLFAKKNWLKNNIRPLLGTESTFKGKIIVDAGAGSGAQSRWMAEAGAKLVISLELSNTIFNRHKETIKGFEDVIFPIQCDIAHLPITVKPDILYCINVLQHTKDPKRTFNHLSSLMRKKTIFLFNVYNKEGFLGSKNVTVFRRVVKRLPFRVWRRFSFFVAFGIFALDKIAPWVIKAKYSDIHYSENFKELWQQIYDAFGAHSYQFTFSQKEQLDMMRKAHLKIKVKDPLGYLLVKNT